MLQDDPAPVPPAVIKPWQQGEDQPVTVHGSNPDPASQYNAWAVSGIPRFYPGQHHQQPYYLSAANSPPFGLVPAGQWSPSYPNVFRNIQESSQQLSNTLSSTMAALSGFVQLIDSTVYSAWSSVTAVVALSAHVSAFHQNYMSGILKGALALVKRLLLAVFGYTERRTGRRAVDARKVAAAVLSGALFLSFLLRRALELHKTQQQHQRQLPHSQHPPVKVKAGYPFSGHNPGHLSILPGDIIFISPEDMDQVGRVTWLRGWTSDGHRGFLPANYVQLVRE